MKKLNRLMDLIERGYKVVTPKTTPNQFMKWLSQLWVAFVAVLLVFYCRSNNIASK